MTGHLVVRGVLARPAEGDCLGCGGLMRLVYDAAEPYAVRLEETGPNPGKPVRFARELLAAALDGGQGGNGDVRFRLRRMRGARHCQLVITVEKYGEVRDFALREETVADFLRETNERVPPGTESRYMDLDQLVENLRGGAA